MNFITEFKRGESGRNRGLPLGIKAVTEDVLGLQKEQIITIAAAPKCGKTTIADFMYLLAPIVIGKKQNPNLNIEIIYYSWEISRIKKEFKIACFFFFYQYKIQTFEHNGEIKKISADYLMGKLIDKDDRPILVKPEHKEILKKIYEDWIVPLFGRYNDKGVKVKKGIITFIEQRENPTGIRNFLMHYAKQNGKFVTEKYTIIDSNGDKEVKERIIGYEENDPEKVTIVFFDHVRKAAIERNFTLKQNVDKLAEYEVEYRNLCKFTFINIIHTNRNVFDLDRLKHAGAGEYFYPTPEDIKDTGNLSEESNLVFTMFDATDDKFNIKKHFGLTIRDAKGRLIYPHYRSLHLVEARDVEGCPLHYQLNMYGNINWFESIKTK